jgi:ketosteroid isomerase-like protein
MTPMDDVVRQLVDEYQLRTLVHAYCRAVDRGDAAALRDLYDRDAVDDHGGFSTGAADDFFTQLTAARPYLRAMQHHITTTNFVIADDVAEGEIYSIAVHTLAAKGRDVDVIVGGRYLDKYVKTADGWRIGERTIVTDWATSNDPSAMDLSHPITRDTLKGSLGPDDPSYRFFSLFSGGRDG